MSVRQKAESPVRGPKKKPTTPSPASQREPSSRAPVPANKKKNAVPDSGAARPTNDPAAAEIEDEDVD